MYYDLLARFSAAVAFLAPRLLRVEIVIAVAVLLSVGLVFSLVVSAAAAFALYVLFVLWLADRHARRRERDGAGLP